MTTAYKSLARGVLKPLNRVTAYTVPNVAGARANIKSITLGNNLGYGGGGQAQIDSIGGIAVDNDGNTYVSSETAHVIFKITASGKVSVFAGKLNTSGTADGVGVAATFNNPLGLAIDSTSTYLYVCEAGSHRIRRITLADATVTWIAGAAGGGVADNATGTLGTINTPTSICIDPDDGTLYVTQTSFNTSIRTVSTTAPYALGTLANTGAGANNHVASICIDDAGENLYIGVNLNNVACPVYRYNIAAAAAWEIVTGATGSASFMNNGGIYSQVGFDNRAKALVYDGSDPARPRLYYGDGEQANVRVIELTGIGTADYGGLVNTLIGPGVGTLNSAITIAAGDTPGYQATARIGSPTALALKNGNLIIGCGGSLSGQSVISSAQCAIYRYGLNDGYMNRFAFRPLTSVPSAIGWFTGGQALQNEPAYAAVYFVPSGETLDPATHKRFQLVAIPPGGTEVLEFNQGAPQDMDIVLEALTPGVTYDVSGLEVT